MKLYKSILLAVSALLAVSCAQEIAESQAESVLPKDQVLTFAAVQAEAQTMEIYADGTWKAEVEAEWIHVDPMYGKGAMTVTVTVEDNYDAAGVVDNPRSANIYFRGASGLPGRYGVLTVAQKGDTYKGKPEFTVAQLVAAEMDAMGKLPSVTVAALAKTGFIAIDETGAVFVQGAPEGIKVGDKVFLNGKRGEVKGLPAFILDETDVRGSGQVTYPAAKEINIADYTAETSEFVSVSGSIVGLVTDGVLSGAAIRIPGQDRRMMIADAPAEAGLAAYNYHKVVASGYYNGTSGSNASFVVATVKDEGIDESVVPVPAEPGSVLFFDDFNWMDPYVALYNSVSSTPLGKSVEENNASGNAPNAYTTAGIQQSGLMDTFAAKGYVDINAAVTSLYPQDTYWKMGKTNCHTGLRIPFVNYFGEVELSFDWSPHMTGSGNIDKVNPVVEVITGETSWVSEPFVNDWQKGKMGWKNVKIKINITPESQIIVRPQYLEDHDGVDQMRWYIDNIKVRVPAPDVPPVYANIIVDKDLFAFEGTGGSQTMKVKSDHDFAVAVSEDWLTCDLYGGDAGDEVAIKVTCAPSELSVLRQAEIIITSGDSSLKIPVVQSAAGQDLDPLISLNKNSSKVSYKGGTVKVTVQSNVAYSVDIDASWVQPAATTFSVDVGAVAFSVEPNEGEDAREAHVSFIYGDMCNVLTITQDAKPKETVLFEDDFSWLDPIVEGYNATVTDAAKKVGNTVDSGGKQSEAPNIWNTAALKSAVEPLFTAKGYTDLNPGEKLMYLQEGCLKFSKTGGHNSALQLQVATMPANPTDVSISFDYCMMVQGDGTVDAGPMCVMIVGDGQFENGTKVSDGFNSAQAKGQFMWNNTGAIKATGVTKDTKFVFVNKRVLNADGSFNWAVGGAGRFFIDNIRIVKLREQVFKDDFSWTSTIAAACIASGVAVGKTVEGQGSDAPNIWNIADLKAAFEPIFTAKGYTDLNPGEKIMYLQDGYLKFSKTGGHNTALQLQIAGLPDTPTDVEISFDYCMMVQGDGTIDAGPVGIGIIGDGQFENGTKLSDGCTSAQETGKFMWNHSGAIKASGVTRDTKFVFMMQRIVKADGTFNWAVSGAGRFFLDNIEVWSK